jgi:muconolactone delta-isomerase
MTQHEYLVEMNFPPFGTLLSPQEALGFAERMALPTIEALEKLADAGKVAAGGTYLGAVGFAFIARVDSAQELEDTLSSLPLWPRAQTRVVPLGTFTSRAKLARGNLARLKAAQQPAGAAP